MTPRRWMQSVMVALLTVVMLGAVDSTSRFGKLGHQMMCVCGCGQILLECNHVGCPDSDRMIGELRQQVGSGITDTAILNWFAAKYGPTVLASPIRGGFDNVAWITPMAVFLLAIVGTGVLVVMWRKRSAPRTIHAGVPTEISSENDDLRERIRRETEY
jgi:cytochrome c-type biogenesis protein CcmH